MGMRSYGYIQIRSKRIPAHRLSYEVNIGKIPDGLEVCHSCDNPGCVNPAHLYVATHRQNIKDSVQRCRRICYLSEEKVSQIKTDYGTGSFSERELARKYSVHRSSINRILSGRAYK